MSQLAREHTLSESLDYMPCDAQEQIWRASAISHRYATSRTRNHGRIPITSLAASLHIATLPPIVLSPAMLAASSER
jgi:hypothetical protein